MEAATLRFTLWIVNVPRVSASVITRRKAWIIFKTDLSEVSKFEATSKRSWHVGDFDVVVSESECKVFNPGPGQVGPGYIEFCFTIDEWISWCERYSSKWHSLVELHAAGCSCYIFKFIIASNLRHWRSGQCKGSPMQQEERLLCQNSHWQSGQCKGSSWWFWINLKKQIKVVVYAVSRSEVLHVGIFYFDLYKVLMDTGALHSSYISRDVVDKHRMLGEGRLCMWMERIVLVITRLRSVWPETLR